MAFPVSVLSADNVVDPVSVQPTGAVRPIWVERGAPKSQRELACTVRTRVGDSASAMT